MLTPFIGHEYIKFVVRTIIIQVHVSKYLWFDVILYACNLINRMPFYFLYVKTFFSLFILILLYFLLYLKYLDVHFF